MPLNVRIRDQQRAAPPIEGAIGKGGVATGVVAGRCQALDRTRVQLIMPSGATGYHTYSTAVRSESPSYLLHGAFLVPATAGAWHVA